jgi:ABC-2 type transport system ATP-binding protein
MDAIITEGLTKRFGSTTALDELNLTVATGEVFGFLGPNGAGKTTTIRLLLGLSRPSAGRARIFGRDCERESIAVHRRCAFVTGGASLWPSLTGAETLALLGGVQGNVDARFRDELIERFDLDPTKRVRSYSKGNQQKISLIAALMTRPDLLLLDEPTSGLDPLMEQVFRSCIREARVRGQTVFLSSHLLGEVEALCDRVAILREGRLVEVGLVAEMRHLRAQHVVMTFSGALPDLTEVEGVRGITSADGELHCEVSGSMAPLISALDHTSIVMLESRAPSLEELFLSHYEASSPYLGGNTP